MRNEMPYGVCMIIIVETTPELITFENTRSGDTFFAWLKEDPTEWIVTRHGRSQSLNADVWGKAELRDGVWLAYAGNLPDTQPLARKSLDEAFEWITNDRAE